MLGDPTEGALKSAALKAGHTPERLEGRFARTAELPFSSERKLMSAAYADAHLEGQRTLFVKGAPDVLLGRCDFERVGDAEVALDDGRRAAITGATDGTGG